jgi:hypothetical protein
MSDFAFSPVNGGAFAHLGTAAAIAHNPAAPPDEQADAGREMMKAYGQESVHPDLLGMVGEWVKLKQAEHVASRMVAKALTYQTPGSDDPKARVTPFLNSYGGGSGGVYIPKPGLPFVALKQLAKRIEVIQAIHRTRKRQLMAFSNPSIKDDAMGWRIMPADPNAELDDDHRAYMHWLTQFLACGGREFDALERRRLGREAFPIFLRKLCDDSLTYDHVAIETVPLRGAKGIDSFFVRDSSGFYFRNRDAGPDGTVPDTFLVQETDPGTIIEFTWEQASVFQRNPQTDLEWCGYGLSEMESSIETISNFLQAISYTREGIDNNAIPRGLMVLSGNYDQTQAQAFNAMWQAKIRGVGNSFGMPVMFSRGQNAAAQYIQTGVPFSEMAFAKWISLQTAIACSIYGMDPAEIGMESFSPEKSSMAGDDTSERLAAAKDKGQRPFFSDIAAHVTTDLVNRFAGWCRFGFTGLQAEDEKWKAMERARMSTIDEHRASLGMDAHPIPSIGALPADAGILQAEFQRYSAMITLDEARKIWGGLDAFPDPKLGITLINASLQAAQQQAMNPQPQEGPGGPEGADGQDGGGDGGMDAQDAPAGPPQGFGAEVSDRLHSLNGSGEDE